MEVEWDKMTRGDKEAVMDKWIMNAIKDPYYRVRLLHNLHVKDCVYCYKFATKS